MTTFRSYATGGGPKGDPDPRMPWWLADQRPLHLLNAELPVGVGIDMGQTHDSTGVVWAQRQGDLVAIRARAWENPYPKGHPLYASWKVSTEEIRGHLRDLFERFPAPMAKRNDRVAPGPAYAYDPWHFRESAELLEDDGLNMVQFPQFPSRMGPASETLYELVKDARLRHDGDPILARHLGAATAKLTRRGWVIDKPEGSSRRIDLAIAAAMAVAMAMADPPKRHVRKARTPVGF